MLSDNNLPISFRCPPTKIMSSGDEVRCETLPDPLDSCCSITVCDQTTLDVMKANLTKG